jgi:hypothetical protein
VALLGGLLLTLALSPRAHAVTAVIDFNDTQNTANVQLITNGPHGQVTNLTIGGRNAVETGGTSVNRYLYMALPTGLFATSKAVWAVVDYYDQGADTFSVDYRGKGGNTTAGEAPPYVTKHDTKAWTRYSIQLTRFNFTEIGPGGADLWIDDRADGPEIIDKITVTDEDPDLTHWPHVDPAHPIKIDGVISPGEWDGAYTVTLNTAAQDALAGVDWGGPQDFSGTYYYKWDESGLYVRGDVTDATPRLNNQTGDQAYTGDGFEEYLALDWSDPTRTSFLPGTDFHVFIGLGHTPMWGFASGHQYFNWGAIPLDNLAIKNTTKPVGYQFEFYQPWQKLLDAEKNTKTVIQAGQQIGWDMFANNSKELPSNQDVAMSPFKRTNPSDDRSIWATVVLEPGLTVTNSPNAGP